MRAAAALLRSATTVTSSTAVLTQYQCTLNAAAATATARSTTALPLSSAWLQHLLTSSCRSMHSSSAALQQQQQILLVNSSSNSSSNQQQPLLLVRQEQGGRMQKLDMQQLSPQLQQYVATLRSGSGGSSSSSICQQLTGQQCAPLQDMLQDPSNWQQLTAQEQQLLRHAVVAGDTANSPIVFSVRPSALSPLHPYHRELQDEEQRLQLLRTTLEAHIKLAAELHPSELEAHAGSRDPVAAALAARRASLRAVFDSYRQLKSHHIMSASQVMPGDMAGYYGMLESMLKHKDQVKEFQRVAEGKDDVWSYWFKKFAPQYAGLPSLGRVEDIYNQQDEEGVLREQLSKLQAVSSKGPRQPQVDEYGSAAAKGGRKTSVAQVMVWRGQGRILVNRKPLDAYFSDLLMRSHVLKPLMHTGLVDQVDVLVHVHGGGSSGQAQAASHGIARALVRLDPALKPSLRAAQLLKRDPRAVERKKFGKAKARKSFAWVKR